MVEEVVVEEEVVEEVVVAVDASCRYRYPIKPYDQDTASLAFPHFHRLFVPSDIFYSR